MSVLQTTYQIQIGEGQTIAFEMGLDTTDGPDELRRVLDMVGTAAERRKAIHDLPFHQARLLSNHEKLEKLRRRKAEAEAALNARVVQMNANRRREAQATPMDINTVAQLDNQIAETEAQIKADEIRIPYLRAVIAGETPPELFPEAKGFLAAAE